MLIWTLTKLVCVFNFSLFTFIGTTLWMCNRHPGKMNSPTKKDFVIGGIIGASVFALSAWLVI